MEQFFALNKDHIAYMKKIYTSLLIFVYLLSPARAEYQSGYNPNEEYNCKYSMGSERFSYTENGVSAPLEVIPPYARNFHKEIREGLKDTIFNFKFAVNGDLIRVSKKSSNYKGPDKALKIFFQEVVENNEDVIISHHVDHDNDIFINTTIFKNDNLINSVENFHFHEIDNGTRKHFSLSWYGHCEKIDNDI